MNEKNAEKKVVSLLVVSILAMASFVPIAIADQPGQPIPRFIYGYCYYMNYGGTPATYADVKLTNSTGAILQIMTDENGIYVADVGSAGWQVGEDVLIEVFGNASQGYDGWYGRAETTVPLTGIWKNITLKPPGWGGLNESFEGTYPPAGWWQVNTTYSTTYAHSGTRSAYFSWSTVTERILRTPALKVKSGDTLNFWLLRYYSAYAGEYFRVDYSTDNSTWITLLNLSYTDINNMTSGTWYFYSLDLSSLAGMTIYIRFYYKPNGGAGIYLDDVVGPSLALPDDDFGVTALTLSPAQTALVPYYEQGTDITINVTVKNFGENSWDEVPVTVKITNYETSTVVYQQTKYTHVIGKLQTENISFTWHAETVCLHTIEAYTELPGDENPANDAAPVKYVGIYKQGGIFESFEGTYPPTYWSQVNTSTSTSYAIHGSYSVYFSFSTVTERILVTPKMVVASGDTFAFWFLKAYTSSAGEYFRVEYGSDLTGWTELMNLTQTELNGMDNYTWYYFSFDLSSLAGQTIQIRFYYAPKGGASIWIDAVKASVMAPYHNAAVISIDAPVSGPAGWQVPAATIKNKGTVQDTFDVTCNIYQFGSSLLSEGFETSVPPPGWTEQIVNDPGTDPDWSQVSSGTSPSCTPHSGSYMAKFNSFDCPSTASARLYTNMLDFSSYPNLFLAFWMYHDTGYSTSLDRIVIQYSLDGSAWNDIATIYRYDGSTGWKQHAVDLSSYVGGQSQAWIGFLAISGYGNNMYIDDVEIKELTLVYTDSGQITLPAGQQGQITFDPWLGLVGTYLVTVDVTVADDYDLTDNHMETIITLTDNIPPEITNVQAIPQIQTNAPPNSVNITAEVTDNVQVALVEAIITYPDTSVHTFPMNEAKGIYYLNQEYNDVGTYYFDIHAVDVYLNENTSTGYWFEITLNNPPDAPTNPYPTDGATGVQVTTVMSVDVSDPDNEPLTVYFYWANDTLIGTATNVPSGGTATIGPITLNPLTTYEWYAVAFDGMYSTASPTWSFTTGMATPPYIEIGNASSTNCTGYVPTYGLFDYSWSAVIYLQSEIGYEFDIVKIAYDVCNNPAMYTFQNQKIYMGHTTLSSWPDSTQPDNSTLTLVYSGPITFNGPGWHEIELQTPFHYNNVDNLVIYWENQDGDWASGYPTFRYTSQTNRSKYDYVDNTWPPPAPGYVGAYMANVRLYRTINYDVGVKSINYPVNGVIYPEGTITVNATVRNYGAQTATFNVNCTIYKDTSAFVQLPHTPSQSWSAATSDQTAGYKVYEDFWDVFSPINKVTWYGLALYYSGGWYAGDPDMNFHIQFYSDDPNDHVNMPPSDLVASFDITPADYTVVATGSTYSGYMLYKFEYTLPSTVSLTGGWIAIQSFADPDGDWFLWMSAQTGDTFSYQEGSGPTTYDRALTFNAGFSIIYTDEETVTNLASGNEQYVEFIPSWSATPGSYNIVVRTLLAGDEVPGNDIKSINVTIVGLKDVGVKSINHPAEGGIYPQGNMVVNATIKNYGTVPAKESEREIAEIEKIDKELIGFVPGEKNCLDSHGYELKGFVVNLTVYKKPGAIIYYQDFEASNGGFVGNGSWQWGIPTSGPNASHSGTKLWATNLAGNYPNYANDRLTSPAIALPAGHNYYLAFWHWYNIEAGSYIYDGGNIKVSTDGSTWQILGSYLNPYPYASAYSGNAGIPGEPCFSGASNGWVFTVMNLSAYAGQTIYLRWHFGSDSIVNYAGWYVDDIAIYQDVAPGQIVFYNEQTVPTLQSNEEYDVSFAPWFAMPGEYLVEVKTKLAGDMNPSNDVKTVNITIQLTNIDVGVKSINYPANGQTFYANDDVYTGATLKNYGVMPADFIASCTIIPTTKGTKEITLLEENFTATWTDQNGDGFTEPPGWINDVYNTGPSSYYYPYWHQNTAYSHTSPAAAFVWWDYEDQDEWLITPLIDLTGAINPKLEFYSYVYRGSTYGDHYYVKISTNNGSTWTTLLDFSSLSGGWDYWTTLYQIDLSAYTGQVVRIAFHAYAIEGLWYAWGIDDVKVTAESVGPVPVYYEEIPVTLGPGEEIDVEFGPWVAQTGDYYIKVKTMLAGDINPDNDEKEIVIHVLPSPLPPETTCVCIGAMGCNNWYISAVTIIFHAEDVEGVAYTIYRINGGEWQTYDGVPVRVRTEGLYVVEYYSVDILGNVEPVKRCTFGIAYSMPYTECIIYGLLGENGWYVSNVTISFIAHAYICGVGAIYYRIDGGAWHSYGAPFVYDVEGTHTIEYYSVSNACITEVPARMTTFKIDKTNPSVEVIYPNGGEVVSGEITVKWTATDNIGIATLDLLYSNDDGLTWNYIAKNVPNTGSYKWNTVGLPYGSNYKVKVYAKDSAGNVGEDTSDRTFTITSPTGPTITTEKPRNALYIFDREIIPTIKPIVIGKLTIEVTVGSDISIAKVEFYIDGMLKFTDTSEPYSWTWNEFVIGTHEIRVVVYDAVGRTAEATAVVFKIF